MGRLIDADALKEVIEDHVTSVSCCATVEQARGKTAFKHECLEDIDNAQTVDAIPVAWLRQYAPEKWSMYMQAEVEIIIEAWQKEQEART